MENVGVKGRGGGVRDRAEVKEGKVEGKEEEGKGEYHEQSSSK